jgi:hypothetical protein
MLLIALIIGHICGSIAESKGRDKKVWFWWGTIVSFIVTFGWHQIHEFKKLKSMNMSLIRQKGWPFFTLEENKSRE